MRVHLPGGVHLHGWRAAAVPVLGVLTVLVVFAGLLGWLPGQGATHVAVAGSGQPGTSRSSGSPSASLAQPVATSPEVLVPVGATAPVPTQAGLSAVLSPLLGRSDLGRHVGAAVVDLATGRLVFGHGAEGAFAPASTTKLLTATAALATLGPGFRIQTRVVQGSKPGQVVLVGGGDPPLSTTPPAGFVPAPASLGDLARATALVLRAAGVRTITLGYDTSAFAGPRTAQTWPSTYLSSGEVAPVTALTVDEGRVGVIAEGPGPRVADPPLAAAQAFARRLAAQGIAVTGKPVEVTAPAAPPAPGVSAPSSSAAAQATTSPTSPGSPAPGVTLASVQSPALSDLVGWMLSTSDNDLAEAVAHLVAKAAGNVSDFDGGVAAVTRVLQSLGVPLAGVRLFDGSGLTGSTQASPAVLADLLALAGSADHPTLRPLLTGLAVAGFTGSLTTRFSTPSTKLAAGLVRAKSGTLSVVSALAGTVVDADGRELAFVFLADEVPIGGTTAAREALDRLVAAVSGCGCR